METKKLKEEFELVKSFYEFPRLNILYLDNYFTDLKSEIENRVKLEAKSLILKSKLSSFKKKCLEAQLKLDFDLTDDVKQKLY